MTDHTLAKKFLFAAGDILKPVLFAASAVLVGVQAKKAITGTELKNVRHIDVAHQEGVIVDGDTFLLSTPKAQSFVQKEKTMRLLP